jgi:hypothetical protein
VCRELVIARKCLLKCLGLGREGKDKKKGVCLHMCHFSFDFFVQNVMCRCGVSARMNEELGEGVLAMCSGMKFKLHDLVDVIVGTGSGVRENKTDLFKGQFKGVV